MSRAEFYLERPWLLDGSGDYFDDDEFPYDYYAELCGEMYLSDDPADDSSDEGDTGTDPFKGMAHSDDTEPKIMNQRKRAMVLGKFKFISRGDGSELESSEAFVKAVQENNTGILEYDKKVQGKRKKNLSTNVGVRLPGYGDRFTVAWSMDDGEIMTDRAVKLYMPEDIAIYEEFSQGPKSPWFGLVEPHMTHNKRIGFDANGFWSVGLLFKHLGTCGLRKWDQQLQELQRIFKWTCQPTGTRASDKTSCPGSERADPPAATLTKTLDQSTVGTSDETTTQTASGMTADFEKLGTGKLQGRIIEWRGTYGFIKLQQKRGPNKVFVHRSDVQSPVPHLALGIQVEFDIAQDPFHAKPKAVNVVVV